MKKRRTIGCLLFAGILLLMSSCSPEYYFMTLRANLGEYYEEEDWATHTIATFGSNGRVQVLMRPGHSSLYEVDGQYIYPIKNDRFVIKRYHTYELEDQKEDKCIQETLYAYGRVGNWLYTYGTSIYVKVNVETMDMVQYLTLEDIPTDERQYFEPLTYCSPIKSVDIWDEETGDWYDECTITAEGDVLYKGEKLAEIGEKINTGSVFQGDGYFGYDVERWQKAADAVLAKRVKQLDMPQTLSTWIYDHLESFKDDAWLTKQAFSPAYDGYREVMYDLSGKRNYELEFPKISVGVCNGEQLDLTKPLTEEATRRNIHYEHEVPRYVYTFLFEQSYNVYIEVTIDFGDSADTSHDAQIDQLIDVVIRSFADRETTPET